MDIEEEEILRINDVIFMLEFVFLIALSGLIGKDEFLVIFCVDILGSMSVIL